MIALAFAITHYCLIFFCQIFNNTTVFPSALLISVGLLPHSAPAYLGSCQAVALYCFIGFYLDAIFRFLPFGFSAIFLLFFYFTQNSIVGSGNSAVRQHRISMEQVSNLFYVIFLFSFRSAAFILSQFLVTLLISQTFVLLFSDPFAALHRRIAAFCDSYAKYKK
jgi:hypothetical protein